MSILTVGLSCFDQFFFVADYPKENTKNVAVDYYESGGSPASNAAYLLGVWGEECHHVSHIGRDLYAEKIVSELESVGVDTSLIIKEANVPTPLANITVNIETGTRTIVLRKKNVIPNVESLRIPDGLLCDVILVDGHELELSKRIIDEFPTAKVVMDGGSVRDSNIELAKFTDYMVVSENFALSFSGIDSFDTKNDLFFALAKLKRICKGQVIITLGERGSAYLNYNVMLTNLKSKSEIRDMTKYSDDLVIVSPSYRTDAIDTTGAGDIFHGAFTYGVSKCWSLEKIIDFASKTAAISVSKKGVRTSMPTLNVVENSNLQKNSDFFSSAVTI